MGEHVEVLKAVLDGTISGRISEWPQLKPAIAYAVAALSRSEVPEWREMRQCPPGVEVVARMIDGSVLVDAIRQHDNTMWWEHRFYDPDRFIGWLYADKYEPYAPPAQAEVRSE